MATILLLTEQNLRKIRGYIIFDRIDIHCDCAALSYDEISKLAPGEPSEKIRDRVIQARHIQEVRFKGTKGVHCNAQMTERMIQEYCRKCISEESLGRLRMGMEKLKLSARAYNRILKVARTIADLAGSEKIESMHIAEAISYRNLDRSDWAERGL